MRVLVVDDHALVREGICSLLASDPTVDIICQSASGEDAVANAEKLLPDVVLMDISLPGISGIEATRRIQRISPQSQIIFLTQHDSLAIAREAMSINAQGYVVKSDAAYELLAAIRTVREGKRFMSRSLIAKGWGAVSG